MNIEVECGDLTDGMVAKRYVESEPDVRFMIVLERTPTDGGCHVRWQDALTGALSEADHDAGEVFVVLATEQPLPEGEPGLAGEPQREFNASGTAR